MAYLHRHCVSRHLRTPSARAEEMTIRVTKVTEMVTGRGLARLPFESGRRQEKRAVATRQSAWGRCQCWL